MDQDARERDPLDELERDITGVGRAVCRFDRPITDEEYAEAIVTLAGAARHVTSGGKAAAQVLLSIYNGGAFHADLSDLVYLDEINRRAALAVIQGRIELRREPHDYLKNGDAVFSDLWELWEGLHVDNRYCPES